MRVLTRTLLNSHPGQLSPHSSQTQQPRRRKGDEAIDFVHQAIAVPLQVPHPLVPVVIIDNSTNHRTNFLEYVEFSIVADTGSFDTEENVNALAQQLALM